MATVVFESAASLSNRLNPNQLTSASAPNGPAATHAREFLSRLSGLLERRQHRAKAQDIVTPHVYGLLTELGNDAPWRDLTRAINHIRGTHRHAYLSPAAAITFASLGLRGAFSGEFQENPVLVVQRLCRSINRKEMCVLFDKIAVLHGAGLSASAIGLLNSADSGRNGQHQWRVMVENIPLDRRDRKTLFPLEKAAANLSFSNQVNLLVIATVLVQHGVPHWAALLHKLADPSRDLGSTVEMARKAQAVGPGEVHTLATALFDDAALDGYVDLRTTREKWARRFKLAPSMIPQSELLPVISLRGTGALSERMTRFPERKAPIRRAHFVAQAMVLFAEARTDYDDHMRSLVETAWHLGDPSPFGAKLALQVHKWCGNSEFRANFFLGVTKNHHPFTLAARMFVETGYQEDMALRIAREGFSMPSEKRGQFFWMFMGGDVRTPEDLPRLIAQASILPDAEYSCRGFWQIARSVCAVFSLPPESPVPTFFECYNLGKGIISSPDLEFAKAVLAGNRSLIRTLSDLEGVLGGIDSEIRSRAMKSPGGETGTTGESKSRKGSAAAAKERTGARGRDVIPEFVPDPSAKLPVEFANQVRAFPIPVDIPTPPPLDDPNVELRRTLKRRTD